MPLITRGDLSGGRFFMRCKKRWFGREKPVPSQDFIRVVHRSCYSAPDFRALGSQLINVRHDAFPELHLDHTRLVAGLQLVGRIAAISRDSTELIGCPGDAPEFGIGISPELEVWDGSLISAQPAGPVWFGRGISSPRVAADIEGTGIPPCASFGSLCDSLVCDPKEPGTGI